MKADKIFFTEFDTIAWHMFLAASDKGVVKISFGANSKFEFFSWLEDTFAGFMYERNEARTRKYVKKIKAFVAGKTRELDVNVDIVAEGFARKVLLALKQVPWGRVVTYGELAAMAGSPRASRAAGTACSKNPIPLIIPCHRVIAAGNRLGGYGGGERLKRWLLENEGVVGLKA